MTRYWCMRRVVALVGMFGLMVWGYWSIINMFGVTYDTLFIMFAAIPGWVIVYWIIFTEKL